MDESLNTIDTTINDLSLEVALIQQYQEELSDLKCELSACRESLSHIEADEEDDLQRQYSRLKTTHFICCHKIKGLINSHVSLTPNRSNTSTDIKGSRIPKLEAPTFDGDILNWTRFWEQFVISIHECDNLSNAEKFVYLQNSLKGGSAKGVIEGLAGTGEHYSKAVDCLKSRYDRPRLIHQSHVKMIIETPSLRDDSGKELRRLHDVLHQHLRALDAVESEPHSRFITSMIQLKLDSNTLFEWQKHTQNTIEVPSFQEILEFIDLRARASETTTPINRRAPKAEHPFKKSVTSFVANPQTGNCVVCKNEKHALYHCIKFKDMSHDRKLSTIRSNNLCMNCLRGGHFLKECNSFHHCRTCQKPHHTLLHMDSQEPRPAVVASNTAKGILPDTLLMTCQVLVKSPDGSKVKVRALLDSASSSSFVSERLVQSLCIPRSHHNITISGIAGLTDQSPLKSVATLEIFHTPSSGKRITVNTIVVPKVTCELPTHPIKFNQNWTHLKDVSLADPHFNRPGQIDMLLGINVYVETMLHGRRTGPPGSPVAFETIFGWVTRRANQYYVLISLIGNHSPRIS